MTQVQPLALTDTALPGFTHRYATVDGVRIHYVIGGKIDGEVLLLLAGFPQSWYAWRKIMPALGEKYRVIAADLPGQGDSDLPNDGYDTQSLATRMHGVLQQLGVERYYLAGHDIGAWVAWTYAALFGQEIIKLALLDAGIPGVTLPETLPLAADKAWRTWHFAFHSIADLPEALISGREEIYLQWFLKRKTANPQVFTDEDMAEYLRIFSQSGGLRAGLAYYRAIELSIAQNRQLQSQGKLTMPLLAISAGQGSIADMAASLRPFARQVTGITLPHSGHFLQEEQPEAVKNALSDFFNP
ncbi:MAG: alpha/beta hydrolase [Rouxiella aceris]|uniref:alpha/beta fold hydrolase n=1 Tax=Rouxiella aceris TaxID=2703884 RepID=UPI0028472BB2|nr:alpha/beta hydrolase [Rouxiella aceris]MDR3434121.1 alpha/beta hydrolase [Rouxiella aceris]